ncbi:MAG: aminopeptidase P family protein [Coriobacteriia bacterium]|nr:aminopeptidase P family protein [Coriobacteriia bacterium]
MNADSRFAALRRRMAESKLPALLVSDIPNVRYVTGFEGVFDDEANVACLLTLEVARIYTDSRYAEAAGEVAQGTPWIVKSPLENVYVGLCAELGEEEVFHIAMEASAPYGRFRFVSEQFRGRVEVIDDFVETQRQVKEAAEVARIAEAAEITDRTMEHVLSMLRAGMTEAEVALEAECFMRRNGAESVAFSPIVASGPNSSRPHATVTDRAIESGDFVVIDIGARVKGYCSDMTRTVVVGTASDRQREMYESVLEANELAIAAVRAGIPGSDLDAVARESLAKKGHAAEFSHGLGHGVGLEVHELPHVSARGRESLRAGGVVTIEPGVYVPGFGGARIEDLVVVEDGGCRVLTRSPKHLMEL